MHIAKKQKCCVFFYLSVRYVSLCQTQVWHVFWSVYVWAEVIILFFFLLMASDTMMIVFHWEVQKIQAPA